MSALCIDNENNQGNQIFNEQRNQENNNKVCIEKDGKIFSIQKKNDIKKEDKPQQPGQLIQTNKKLQLMILIGKI